MYEIRKDFKNLPYDQLQLHKLGINHSFEVLGISMEKDTVFPQHTSPTDVLLVVLEGIIEFHIIDQIFKLSKQETFSFSKEMPHHVRACENAKFLIIR